MGKGGRLLYPIVVPAETVTEFERTVERERKRAAGRVIKSLYMKNTIRLDTKDSEEPLPLVFENTDGRLSPLSAALFGAARFSAYHGYRPQDPEQVALEEIKRRETLAKGESKLTADDILNSHKPRYPPSKFIHSRGPPKVKGKTKTVTNHEDIDLVPSTNTKYKVPHPPDSSSYLLPPVHNAVPLPHPPSFEFTEILNGVDNNPRSTRTEASRSISSPRIKSRRIRVRDGVENTRSLSEYSSNSSSSQETGYNSGERKNTKEKVLVSTYRYPHPPPDSAPPTLVRPRVAFARDANKFASRIAAGKIGRYPRVTTTSTTYENSNKDINNNSNNKNKENERTKSPITSYNNTKSLVLPTRCISVPSCLKNNYELIIENLIT